MAKAYNLKVHAWMFTMNRPVDPVVGGQGVSHVVPQFLQLRDR